MVVIHTDSSWSVMKLGGSDNPMQHHSITKSDHRGVLSLPLFSAATVLSNQHQCPDQPGSIPCRLIQQGSSSRLLLLSASAHTSVGEDEENVPWSDFFWDDNDINDAWRPNSDPSVLPSGCRGRWRGVREKRQPFTRVASIRLLDSCTGMYTLITNQ